MTLTIPFAHSTLGFERFFDEVDALLRDTTTTKTQTQFPPHNIIKLDDSRYVVELAIAGFGKDEIDITVDDGRLTIKGNKANKDESIQYLHRGIGTRSFTKTLTVADTIEVRGAEFKDGILRIGLENIVPDHKKPRKIEIGSELKEFKPQLLNEATA
jgi:molecular chaperone IbpA